MPSWNWIDITDVFDYIFGILEDLWEWSDTCGIIFYGTYVSWRALVVAGLFVALLLRRLVGSYEDDYDASVELGRKAFNGESDQFFDGGTL